LARTGKPDTADGFTTVDHDPERPRREHHSIIYAATALVTRQVGGMPASSTSLPSLVAEMLELLELGEGMTVLEIGEIRRLSAAGPRFATSAPGGPPGQSEEGTGFLFFLGRHDRRAGWTPRGPGLSDGGNGWAAAGDGGFWWWKEESLARELHRLYQDWDARERPLTGDYQVSFLPAGQSAGPPAGGWQIRRRFYHELVRLDA
jgi:hypothetical protein